MPWPQALSTALHKLWTKNVGMADYNKQEWKDLEREIERVLVLVPLAAPKPIFCRYCTNVATHFVVWLRDRNGKPGRIRVRHCGCDLDEAMKQFWPNPYPVVKGEDYIIEPLPKI